MYKKTKKLHFLVPNQVLDLPGKYFESGLRQETLVFKNAFKLRNHSLILFKTCYKL